jgi:hypothetical protein
MLEYFICDVLCFIDHFKLLIMVVILLLVYNRQNNHQG